MCVCVCVCVEHTGCPLPSAVLYWSVLGPAVLCCAVLFCVGSPKVGREREREIERDREREIGTERDGGRDGRWKQNKVVGGGCHVETFLRRGVDK